MTAVVVAIVLVAALVGLVIWWIQRTKGRRPESGSAAASAALGPRAWHDAATGRFAEVVGRGDPVAVLAINLDRLAMLNRRCGRGTGDAILDSVATILLTRAGPAGLVGHIAGDHFVVLLVADAVRARMTAQLIADEVRGLSRHPSGGGSPVGRLTVSIGAAVHPYDGPMFDDLVMAADVLLFAAKDHRDQISLSRPPPSEWRTRLLAG